MAQATPLDAKIVAAVHVPSSVQCHRDHAEPAQRILVGRGDTIVHAWDTTLDLDATDWFGPLRKFRLDM